MAARAVADAQAPVLNECLGDDAEALLAHGPGADGVEPDAPGELLRVESPAGEDVLDLSLHGGDLVAQESRRDGTQELLTGEQGMGARCR